MPSRRHFLAGLGASLWLALLVPVGRAPPLQAARRPVAS